MLLSRVSCPRDNTLREHVITPSLLPWMCQEICGNGNWISKVIDTGHQLLTSRTEIKCIHESGCTAAFPETEIRRFLEKSTFKRLSKLRTEKELRDVYSSLNWSLIKANLEGLVYCPFCPFAAIMEDPTDKVFECLQCGEISCRYCRVKSHHPMSCERIIHYFARIDSRLPKRETCRCDTRYWRSYDGGITPKL